MLRVSFKNLNLLKITYTLSGKILTPNGPASKLDTQFDA